MSDLTEESRAGAGPRQKMPQLRGAGSRRGRLLDIEDRIFTEWRIRFYGTGVVVGLAIAIVLSWARGLGHFVIGPDGKLGNIDFCWIWVSGKFAAMSDPSTIFDRALYAAAQNVFYRPGECLYLHQYVYPPTFLFLSYPLGLMPYLAAFTVWVVATLLVYATAIYAIIPRSAALIAALASGAALKNIQLGHNGFLTAGLFGLSLVFVERRPWLSGVFLGLLTYKPQFGVLFPLALLASRNWRALAGAMATSLALAAAAAAAFGHQTWPAFIASLVDRNADLSPQAGAEFLLESFYGLLHWAGAAAWLAWSVHLAIAVGVALAVFVVWAKPIPYALKAAMLCLGSLLVTPYVLRYDLCILSIAAAFLVEDGLARGFLAGERTVLLIAFAGLYCLIAPVGPIVCAALLFLVFRRIAGVPRADDAVLRNVELAPGDLSPLASLAGTRSAARRQSPKP
jgi:hypothetical protein